MLQIKTGFLFIFFFAIGLDSFGQDTTYFDATWKETTKESAQYYRTIVKAKEFYLITDFFLSHDVQFKALAQNQKDPLLYVGEANWYYKDGSKWGMRNFVNGLQEGESKLYYPDGSLRQLENYSNGIKNGPYKMYLPSGNMSFEGMYKDDKLDGKAIDYFADSDCRYEISYKEGDIEGPYQEVWNKNVVLAKGNFLANYRSGIWQEFHKNGQLKKTYNIKNKLLEGEYLEYDSLGYKIAFGQFQNGLPMRYQAKIFNPFTRDTIQFKIVSKNGMEEWKINKNNKPALEAFYKAGKKVGVWSVYDDEGKNLYQKFDFSTSNQSEINWAQRVSTNALDDFYLSKRFWDYNNIMIALNNQKKAKITNLYSKNTRSPFIPTIIANERKMEAGIDISELPLVDQDKNKNIVYLNCEANEIKTTIFISSNENELKSFEKSKKPIKNEVFIFYLLDMNDAWQDIFVSISDPLMVAIRYELIPNDYLIGLLKQCLKNDNEELVRRLQIDIDTRVLNFE